jgi:uncharacterized delta-60 repeat protein
MKLNARIQAPRRMSIASPVVFLVATALAFIATCGMALAAGGDLDKHFGHHGKVVRDLGRDDEAVAVATKGGRNVTVGDVEVHNHEKLVVSRFDPDGRLDRDFASHGTRKVAVPGDGYARDVAIQPSGTIVVAFVSDAPGAERAFGVARIRPGGKLDKSFDHDGIQTTGFGAGFRDAYAEGVALGPEGKILVAGEVYTESYGYDIALVRYTSDGQLDESFSGDGRQTTDVNQGSDQANSIALDDSGRIVVGGTTRLNSANVDRLLIARYDTSGELDPSFSVGGILTSNDARSAEDIVTVSGGRIVAVGTDADDFMVARFSALGPPDGSFSDDGVQAIDFADGVDQATSVALSGEKLVVAGSARTRRRADDFATARLRSDGHLDRSFSHGGLRTVDLSLNDDEALGVSIDSHSRVVLAGSATHRGGGEDRTDTGLVRLLGRG